MPTVASRGAMESAAEPAPHAPASTAGSHGRRGPNRSAYHPRRELSGPPPRPHPRPRRGVRRRRIDRPARDRLRDRRASAGGVDRHHDPHGARRPLPGGRRAGAYGQPRSVRRPARLLQPTAGLALLQPGPGHRRQLRAAALCGPGAPDRDEDREARRLSLSWPSMAPRAVERANAPWRGCPSAASIASAHSRTRRQQPSRTGPPTATPRPHAHGAAITSTVRR